MSRTWRDMFKFKAKSTSAFGATFRRTGVLDDSFDWSVWRYYALRSGDCREKNCSYCARNRSQLERVKKEFENKYRRRALLLQVYDALCPE